MNVGFAEKIQLDTFHMATPSINFGDAEQAVIAKEHGIEHPPQTVKDIRRLAAWSLYEARLFCGTACVKAGILQAENLAGLMEPWRPKE